MSRHEIRHHTLHSLERVATEMGIALMGDPAPCRDKNQSCVKKESERPLTRAEKKEGWVRRPFHGYEPHRMCNACAAY